MIRQSVSGFGDKVMRPLIISSAIKGKRIRRSGKTGFPLADRAPVVSDFCTKNNTRNGGRGVSLQRDPI